MKILALLLLLLPCLSMATEKFREPTPLLSADENPAPAADRRLASVGKSSSNEEVFGKLTVGTRAITQNSFGSWNNEVVKVIEVFDDNSVRLKFDNGRTPIVKFKNLSKNLSPAAPCGHSHGAEICKGDRVLYPLASASLMIPEAEVIEVFENNQALLRDGTDFQANLEQVGKATDCSPQKPSICQGSYVLAEGFNNGARHVFEGTVEKAYTHGPVLVRVSPTLLIPIDATAVKKRVAAEASVEDPAVLSNHGFHGKPSYTVMPELEPLDPAKADSVKEAR
ncbi:MAG: hypothetical protein AB7K68_17385 [Bacteriovoracia bacterium]